MSGKSVAFILETAVAEGGVSYAEAIKLLSLAPASEEATRLKDVAHEASLAWTGGKGLVWLSIGVDFVPCPMSCSFCSFGEKWGLIKKPWRMDEDEILKLVRRYDVPEVAYVVLRTTEFYRLDDLLRIGRRIQPLKHARLVANTGELSVQDAKALHEAGFHTTYHAMRLREGVDTGIDAAARLRTLKNIAASPLELAALVDPVGPEHGVEEIARSMFLHKEMNASVVGAMARFAVPGTPKHALSVISPSRLAQITAVARLAAGPHVQAICAHPANEDIVRSGANTVVVEYGAIPRDAEVSKGEWRRFGVSEALDLLRGAGHKV